MLRICCRFHRQESGFRRCDLKIEVARDFYAPKQRISTSWGVSTSRLLEESSLRRVTVADYALAHELDRLAESNFPASYLNLSIKLSVLLLVLHADLP